MEEGRLSKEVTKWRPPGRRKRGRPKFNWAEGITGLMGEKGLVEEDWNDRNNWRKKIIQCVALATEPGISLIINKIWRVGFNPVWTQMVATSSTCYDVVTFLT
jgi:hypothetical protein